MKLSNTTYKSIQIVAGSALVIFLILVTNTIAYEVTKEPEDLTLYEAPTPAAADYWKFMQAKAAAMNMEKIYEQQLKDEDEAAAHPVPAPKEVILHVTPY